MSNAINRCAETRSPPRRPPIFASMITIVAVSIDGKILPTSGDVLGVGWVNRKIKGVDYSTRCIALGGGGA
jgi:hypothetical protein